MIIGALVIRIGRVCACKEAGASLFGSWFESPL